MKPKMLIVLALMILLVSGCRVHEAKNGNDSNTQNVVINLFGVVVQDTGDDSSTSGSSYGQQSQDGYGAFASSLCGGSLLIILLLAVAVYNRQIKQERNEKWN